MNARFRHVYVWIAAAAVRSLLLAVALLARFKPGLAIAENGDGGGGKTGGAEREEEERLR